MVTSTEQIRGRIRWNHRLAVLKNARVYLYKDLRMHVVRDDILTYIQYLNIQGKDVDTASKESVS